MDAKSPQMRAFSVSVRTANHPADLSTVKRGWVKGGGIVETLRTGQKGKEYVSEAF